MNLQQLCEVEYKMGAKIYAVIRESWGGWKSLIVSKNENEEGMG